jgi:hypothetical protein
MTEFYEFIRNFGFPAGLVVLILYGLYLTVGYLSKTFVEPFFKDVVSEIKSFLLDLKGTLGRAEGHLTRQVDSVQVLAKQSSEIAEHNQAILTHNKAILSQNHEILDTVKMMADKLDSISVKVDHVVIHAGGQVAIVSPPRSKTDDSARG